MLTGRRIHDLEHLYLLPATHYIIHSDEMERVFDEIRHDCLLRVKEFEESGKLIEAQRIKERVFYDLEMMKEVGT